MNDSNTNNTREIVIDGTTAQLKENMRYRGAGMVSANNSSRLLLDYKAEHPEAYKQIMEYMFSKDGIGITHLKVEMGADIKISNERESAGEKTADITVKTSSLKGITIGGDIIPRLIDEIPVIAVAACFAQGQTVVKDAQELKVKETNRIKTVAEELSKMGADITETEDGMIINGVGKLNGAVTESHNDHRIAMSAAVAGLMAEGETTINNSECVDISFPGFFELVNSLR